MLISITHFIFIGAKARQTYWHARQQPRLQQARLLLVAVHPRSIALRMKLRRLRVAGVVCDGGKCSANVVAEWGRREWQMGEGGLRAYYSTSQKEMRRARPSVQLQAIEGDASLTRALLVSHASLCHTSHLRRNSGASKKFAT